MPRERYATPFLGPAPKREDSLLLSLPAPIRRLVRGSRVRLGLVGVVALFSAFGVGALIANLSGPPAPQREPVLREGPRSAMRTVSASEPSGPSARPGAPPRAHAPAPTRVVRAGDERARDGERTERDGSEAGSSARSAQGVAGFAGEEAPEGTDAARGSVAADSAAAQPDAAQPDAAASGDTDSNGTDARDTDSNDTDSNDTVANDPDANASAAAGSDAEAEESERLVRDPLPAFAHGVPPSELDPHAPAEDLESGEARARSDALRGRAARALAAGDEGEAEALLHRAFLVRPLNPHVSADLARLYLEQDEPGFALPWARRAVRLRRRRAVYRRLLSEVLQAMGEREAARRARLAARRRER
ncbi:MAG TPA: hypothetical protein RMG45_00435 [Polyangiaceae bacterium LLY-WYZ-15_(1-7)]|nr:hypothetical protein [Polyangiaceae bacterium LLY-WYZ-15_(1-7)]